MDQIDRMIEDEIVENEPTNSNNGLIGTDEMATIDEVIRTSRMMTLDSYNIPEGSVLPNGNILVTAIRSSNGEISVSTELIGNNSNINTISQQTISEIRERYARSPEFNICLLYTSDAADE